jgi:hypothetical protein
MKSYDAFNQTDFSKFLNKPVGRVFRFAAGIGFVFIGYVYRNNTLGIFSMVWGALALSAGAFDMCFISAALGGPLSGSKIRSIYK